MVIDSSALLAIILGEDDRMDYLTAIRDALDAKIPLRLPAPVVVEVGIGASRRSYETEADTFIESIQAEVVPLTVAIAELSIQAFRKFGKGVHKAGLNFGDCMSYATAEYLKAPLLYKGRDFALTPIRSALPKIS
jgi:ribonuclease VapC